MTLGRFETRALERQFESLERLDRALWLPALINSHGPLFERLRWLDHALPRLAIGVNPLADEPVTRSWPGPAAAQAFGLAIERLGLPALVAGQAEWRVQLVRSLLWHLDSLARLGAQHGEAAALAALAQAFADQWETERADLEQIVAVFQSLEGFSSLARWSEVRGVLRGEGWDSVLAAHRTIRDSAALAALIRALGRSRLTEAWAMRPRATVAASAKQRLDAERWQAVLLAGERGEPDGVHRSAALDRVLASELAVWRRRSADPATERRLRRIFAAKLSEHALLSQTPREPDRVPIRMPVEAILDATRPIAAPRMETGPIIVCLDTSSSMAGAAEQVAKAVVLEAMRTARQAGRGCVVYAFGGPGEVQRTVLDQDVDGLVALAGLLSASFHGGTDIAEPIEAAMADLGEAQWAGADLLIVSDGEFGVTADVLAEIAFAREHQQLRVQGILIGDRETLGLRELCDSIFWVADWRRFGSEPARGDSPVHDSALTRLFFPAASMRAPPSA